MHKVINGKSILFLIEGAVGETSDMFSVNLRDFSDVTVDFSKLTYFNSIGIRAWIRWMVQVLPQVKFTLRNCTVLILNQVSTVKGFVPAHTIVESANLPFHCDSCNSDTFIHYRLGHDYQYKNETTKSFVQNPSTIFCPKCREPMDPDFTAERSFSFLTQAV